MLFLKEHNYLFEEKKYSISNTYGFMVLKKDSYM